MSAYEAQKQVEVDQAKQESKIAAQEAANAASAAGSAAKEAAAAGAHAAGAKVEQMKPAAKAFFNQGKDAELAAGEAERAALESS